MTWTSGVTKRLRRACVVAGLVMLVLLVCLVVVSIVLADNGAGPHGGCEREYTGRLYNRFHVNWNYASHRFEATRYGGLQRSAGVVNVCRARLAWQGRNGWRYFYPIVNQRHYLTGLWVASDEIRLGRRR